MKNIEMHCHSKRSDGKNTLEEIINEAKRLDLGFLSLTDHDIISPKEFQQQLRQSGIGTCDSAEISARNYDIGKSLHLLSYAKIFHNSLHEVLENSQTIKKGIIIGQLQKLIFDFNFSGGQAGFTEYMQKNGRDVETANRYDISLYLYNEPCNKEKMISILGDLLNNNDIVTRFFEECLKRGGKLYSIYGYEGADYEPSVEQTVDEVVHKAGGIVSMAHPNVTFNEYKGGIPEFERTIGDYVNKGIRGIEINTMASAEWVEVILKARKKYNLILTSGSDCHHIGYNGDDGKHSTIGCINSFLETDVYEQNFGRFKNIIGLGSE